MDYDQSFENELPSLKTEEEKKAVKAAVLRFINEFREQMLNISSKNTSKVITGGIEVGTVPTIVLNENSNRKVGYVKNMGTAITRVYGVDQQSNGGYTLNMYEQVSFNGTNSIAALTLSGVSFLDFLDS